MKTKLTIEKDWAYIFLTPDNDYERKTLFIISGMQNVSTNFEQQEKYYWYGVNRENERKRENLKSSVIKVVERPVEMENTEVSEQKEQNI